MAAILDVCSAKLEEKEFKSEYARCKVAAMTGKKLEDVPAPVEREELSLNGASDGSYIFAPDLSSVRWTAAKVTGGKHMGSIGVQEGSITVANGEITGGSVQIDMTSLANNDLTDASMKSDLEGHLKSPDFFDVGNHPTATFEITKAGALNNYRAEVEGNLTIKGQTQAITVNMTVADVGKTVVVTGATSFDRTQFGINYGSGLAGAVGDNVINDLVALNFSLSAPKQ